MELLTESGVYKLIFNDCNSLYIARTTRSFYVRVNDHLRAVNGNGDSEFANHLLKIGHTFEIN